MKFDCLFDSVFLCSGELTREPGARPELRQVWQRNFQTIDLSQVEASSPLPSSASPLSLRETKVLWVFAGPDILPTVSLAPNAPSAQLLPAPTWGMATRLSLSLNSESPEGQATAY